MFSPYSKDVRLPVQLQRAMAAEAEAAREARAKVSAHTNKHYSKMVEICKVHLNIKLAIRLSQCSLLHIKRLSICFCLNDVKVILINFNKMMHLGTFRCVSILSTIQHFVITCPY